MKFNNYLNEGFYGKGEKEDRKANSKSKLPMERRAALNKIEDTDDRDALGFYVRIANLAGATTHELRAALDGKDYNMFKGDVNDKKYKKYLGEGLRGENYYYEWNLMNKSESDAKKALKAHDFKEGGVIGYKNRDTKEMADIQDTKDGWKINIYDTHGKKLA